MFKKNGLNSSYPLHPCVEDTVQTVFGGRAIEKVIKVKYIVSYKLALVILCEEEAFCLLIWGKDLVMKQQDARR